MAPSGDEAALAKLLEFFEIQNEWGLWGDFGRNMGPVKEPARRLRFERLEASGRHEPPGSLPAQRLVRTSGWT